MKRYNTVDFFKFFMSFFVVAIHTDFDNEPFTKYICPLVVPMFFCYIRISTARAYQFGNS